jgi:hypothetical protein
MLSWPKTEAYTSNASDSFILVIPATLTQQISVRQFLRIQHVSAAEFNFSSLRYFNDKLT